MPKIVDKEIITAIISLRNDSRLSFVKIGKKVNLHPNSVSRIYKQNANTLVQDATKVINNSSSNVKSLVQSRKSKINSVRDDMFMISQEVADLLEDELLAEEFEYMLNDIGLHTEASVKFSKGKAVEDFKEKVGLTNFQDEDLEWISEAWIQFWNEIRCSDIDEIEAMSLLKNALCENRRLIEEGIQLKAEITRLEFQRMSIVSRIEQLQKQSSLIKVANSIKLKQLANS